MYVCMYECMYVRMCVCMQVCVHVRMHVCRPEVCIHIQRDTERVCSCMCVWPWVCVTQPPLRLYFMRVKGVWLLGRTLAVAMRGYAMSVRSGQTFLVIDYATIT